MIPKIRQMTSGETELDKKRVSDRFWRFGVEGAKVFSVPYRKYIPEIKHIYENVFFKELDLYSGNYENDKYDDHSIHFLAENNIDKKIGYIRVIKPNKFGFPALEIVQPNVKIDNSSCVEFSKLMVVKDHRNRKDNNIAAMLMKEAFFCTLRLGYKYILVDVFKDRRFNTYSLFKSLGFEECSAHYKDFRYRNDSFSVLMLLNISKVIRNFERQKYFLGNLEYEVDRIKLAVY